MLGPSPDQASERLLSLTRGICNADDASSTSKKKSAIKGNTLSALRQGSVGAKFC